MSISTVVVTLKDNPSNEMEVEKYLQYIKVCDGHRFKGRYATASQESGRLDVRGIVYQDDFFHTNDLYIVFDIGISLNQIMETEKEREEMIGVIRDIRLMAGELPLTEMYPTAVGLTGVIAGGAVKFRERFNNLQREQTMAV